MTTPPTLALDIVSRAMPTLRRNILIVIADIALLVLCMNLLPFDEKANRGLALMAFIGVLWLTEAIHTTLTALLVPLLAVGLGLLDTTNALASFANPIIFLFFGGFALAVALQAQGLDKLLANGLLSLARGHLGWASLILFGGTALLSMWVNNTSTTAMVLPLALGILSKIDPERHRSTHVFVLLGVAFSANIGGLGTVVGSAPNAIAAAHLGIDFMTWFAFGAPLALTLLVSAIAVMYLQLRPRLNERFALDAEPVPWNRARVGTLAIFLATVICWIFSQPISALLGGVKQLDALIAVSAAVAIGVSGVANWSQIQRGTDWGVLMLFGGGLTLSIVLRSSGASEIMSHGVTSLVGQDHALLVVLASAAFVIFLTEFTSNTASAALLIPIFASVAQSMGMSVMLLTSVIAVGASCAFMLPVATPPNAIVFGTGRIRQSDMIRVGLRLNVLSLIVLTSFAWIVWR
ncbi:Anion transporter [Pandoraea terrae]|uniref:Anion transporter n=1 Tax=Pandoraea terrae TaxID=1537710 RepID=A0A5E4UTX1_9BURK|nr:DASS family sodium-coupled anion symporter [Pandoraea terrae]VVE02934.1 Anion transporter [Pandoraea terrae]